MAEKSKKQKIEGEVIETLPNTLFRVRLDDDREVLAYLAGKMRIHHIKVMIGDRVTMEMAPGDGRARIVFRK